jgi:outer membrane protein OmpU
MQKTLLGTSALVASGVLASPAFAADPIKINVLGYLQSYIGIGHYDRDGTGRTSRYEPVNFKYEGEIWFQGQTKLDNGTSIGLRVELEAWSQGGTSFSASTDSKDQMDEEYLFAFGDWGRAEFGSTDAASFKMTYTTPTALIGHSFVQHGISQWRGIGSVSANAADHSGFSSNSGIMAVDANKLSYYTPRIAGLQAGFSFTPYFKAANGTLGGNAAQCGFLGGGANHGACPRNSDNWRYGMDFGVNYLNKLGDVNIALYGGYARAWKDRNNNTTSTIRDFSAWAFGANVALYGWTIGGGVGNDNNGISGNGTFWYTAGLMYETGPWQASFGWWRGRRKEKDADTVGSGGAVGTDKVSYFTVGVNYALGPGVKLVGGFIYDVRSGQTIAEKADAWQFLFGTELRF